MPLPPLSSPVTSASRATFDRLRDAEAHLDQYTPAQVVGPDGWLYHCMAGLPEHAAEVEPYPRFTPPLLRLNPDAQELDEAAMESRSGAMVNRLESRLDDWGFQEVSDGVIARANSVAFLGRHDLQVGWDGSHWIVASGGIRWPDARDVDARNGGGGPARQQRFPRTRLQGSGWIVLLATFAPRRFAAWADDFGEADGAFGYEVTPTGIAMAGAATLSFPRFRLKDVDGSLRKTWDAAQVALPVAYVEAPSAGQPARIQQFATGSWDFATGRTGHAWNTPLPQAFLTNLQT